MWTNYLKFDHSHMQNFMKIPSKLCQNELFEILIKQGVYPPPLVLYSFSAFYIHVFSNIPNFLGVSFKMSYYQPGDSK